MRSIPGPPNQLESCRELLKFLENDDTFFELWGSKEPAQINAFRGLIAYVEFLDAALVAAQEGWKEDIGRVEKLCLLLEEAREGR